MALSSGGLREQREQRGESRAEEVAHARATRGWSGDLMAAFVIAVVVGSGALSAHALSDMENGYLWHSPRWDVAALALSLPVFALSVYLWF